MKISNFSKILREEKITLKESYENLTKKSFVSQIKCKYFVTIKIKDRKAAKGSKK